MAVNVESIKRELERALKKLKQLEEKNRQLQQQIDELKYARDRVAASKSRYEGLQKATQKIVEGEHHWKGRRYNMGMQYFYRIKHGDEQAVDDIDAALDAMERDIGRLEREIYDNLIVIGDLVKAINWLRHEIKAAIN